MKGSGVSNSLNDEVLLIPLTVSAVVIKEQLREVRFGRYQKVAGCIYAPIKDVLGLDLQVLYVCRGCARSLLCLSFHTCNLRSDDTEMQLDSVEAETGII